ncbi:hypothetical protein SLS60_010190 [Paraconiothyrium brasiliense]|uniref:C3H1-type domain-containing protein n=1 Tax=Paraconiothyrium brasiliense TaxID=300254 RepID=A0ABR3QQJ5_9PLEO
MDQETSTIVQDQQELAKLSDQLQSLQLHGAGQFQHLRLAVDMCAQSLKEYAAEHNGLLAKFTRLQKNYEALSIGQPSGERVAPGQSYVVVLIDAHSHKFKDELLADKSKGGPLAARRLREAVEEYLLGYLRDQGQCRIMLQAYANLKHLSMDAAKKGLVDSRPLSLATFTSGFSNRVDCDFIDVQDKSNIQQKVQKRLWDCLEDPRCVQVFLAAAGGERYTETIHNLSECDGRITLVRTLFLDKAQLKSTLPSVSFPRVFRTHEKDRGRVARGNASFEETPKERDPNNLQEISGTNITRKSKLPDFSLPGLIPVNASNERLDSYMRVPTPQEWADYTARTQLKKPCGYYHLGHACMTTPCEYDHSPLESGAVYCMQFLLKSFPCKEGSKCRRLDCVKGHICQKEGCDGRSTECKMKNEMHKSDLRVSNWVKPSAKHAVDDDSVSSIDDFLIDLSD